MNVPVKQKEMKPVTDFETATDYICQDNSLIFDVISAILHLY
jgi:hypothetical protein